MKRFKIAELFLWGIIGYIVLGIASAEFPWYTQELPYRVEKEIYAPGQVMKLSFKRNARISMMGNGVIELVRIKKQALPIWDELQATIL